MSAQQHDFNCPACLHCARCSRSMQSLQEFYVPCEGGVKHLHLGLPRAADPYVPDWAQPLSGPRSRL